MKPRADRHQIQRPAGSPAGRFVERASPAQAVDAAASRTGPTLARILREVIRCVACVHAGQSWSALAATVAPALRPAVQALAFAVWRKQGLARAIAARLVAKQPDAQTHAALVCALALLNTEPAPYPAHTLVSQTIDCLRANKRLAAKAGFVNACLRRYLRERETLHASICDEASARWNLPAWWIKRLQIDHPEHWEQIATQSHISAPMVVRAAWPRPSANKQVDTDATQAVAFWMFVDTERAANRLNAVGEFAWALQHPMAVSELPGFDRGEVSIQDAAAQLAAPLLLRATAPGRLRVLDACAAPGGKTVHLAQWLQAERSAHQHVIIALERDAARAARIEDNLRRCGLLRDSRASHQPHAVMDAPAVDVRVQVADAARPQDWWDGEAFDAVLLDAPCTASGIVRRHPDVVWLRRESDIAQLAAEQGRLLDALWPLVRRGGHLLYCTCSVFRAEGSEQAQAFVSRNTDALALPAPGHLLPRRSTPGDPFTDNEPCERDGFFYALFQKRADA